MTIRLNVNGYEDRTNVVMALVNNGYKVSVEKEPQEYSLSKNYWVIVEDPTVNEESNMKNLNDKCFPAVGTKNLIFKLKDGRILRGKYDFNDTADMKWIANDGNEYSSDLVVEWEEDTRKDGV